MKDFLKGRHYVVYTVLNRLDKPPYKEVVTIRDLTGKRQRGHDMVHK